MSINFYETDRWPFGRWFTPSEARQVERHLLDTSGTGEMWYWKNRDGQVINFTASPKPEQPSNTFRS